MGLTSSKQHKQLIFFSVTLKTYQSVLLGGVPSTYSNREGRGKGWGMESEEKEATIRDPTDTE